MKISISQVSVMNFFLMLGLAIVFAVDETFFVETSTELYDFYLAIAPQIAYAVISLVTAVILMTGFVFKNQYIEIFGMFISGLMTLVILSGYLLSFPNIASVILSVWTLSTFVTIADMVGKIQDNKEEN